MSTRPGSTLREDGGREGTSRSDDVRELLPWLIGSNDYATLSDALNDGANLNAGDTITVGGLRGQGDTFEVTTSGNRTDGGICFMFEDDLTQVVESQNSIDHTNLSWRSVEIRYGSDTSQDVIHQRQLHGYIGHRSSEPTPWVDLVNGSVQTSGWSILSDLKANTSGSDFYYTYKHTNSDRRLERQNVGNSVKPEWWGAETADPNNPKEQDPELRWAMIVADRIWEDGGNNYDWVYVDLEGTYYYQNELWIMGGTKFRGVGPLDHDSDIPADYQDSFTRGGLRLLPGEALFYRKDGYDPWSDPDRERVHSHLKGMPKGRVTSAPNPEKVGMEKIKIDGNVRNNMQVFNNFGDYSSPDGSSITDWLQDSGDWNGFYSVGGDWPNGMPFEVDDVSMDDLGASGLSTGNGSVSADMTVNNLDVNDARRNHLVYGLVGDNLDNITVEGQFWGSGLVLNDPRGTNTSPTYTNLTVNNLEEGQFGYNTIMSSRGTDLTVDGFTVDLRGLTQNGSPTNILLARALGNTFKNGTIYGYEPGGYNAANNGNIFDQNSLKDSPDKKTLLKNVTFIDQGVVGILVSQHETPIRVEGFEYQQASGVSTTGASNQRVVGGYKVPSTSRQPHAIRVFYKNTTFNIPTEETFKFQADNDSILGNVPLDWYWVGGSYDNEHGNNSIVNEAGGLSWEATHRSVRLYLNDTEFRTQTEQNTSNTSRWWHTDLSRYSNVRLRNCTDKQGRVSDNSGTYTSDAGDEGNDYVIIDPNLLSNPHYRTATVTSGTPSVTGVQVVDENDNVISPVSGTDFVDAQKHKIRVNLDQAIGTGNTIDVDWTAKVTPPDQYQTTGLFIARRVEDEDGNPSLSYNSGNGPFTYDLRGVASSQESGEKIVYTASSGDTSVVTANVQSDDYTLELTEQGTGTATITVDAEIPSVGMAQTTFDVTIS